MLWRSSRLQHAQFLPKSSLAKDVGSVHRQELLGRDCQDFGWGHGSLRVVGGPVSLYCTSIDIYMHKCIYVYMYTHICVYIYRERDGYMDFRKNLIPGLWTVDSRDQGDGGGVQAWLKEGLEDLGGIAWHRFIKLDGPSHTSNYYRGLNN